MTSAPTVIDRSRAGLDRWWAPAVVALIGATAFALARLIIAGHGDIASFIIVGSLHARAAQVPRGIPVVNGPGYDGQFYFRMALDPINFHERAFGIAFDTRSRLERIGYPTLSWLSAGGNRSLIPDTMVAVNIVALGAVALAGGFIARMSDRHSLWGLLVAAYPGYLWSVSRDLTEVSAAAFLLGGLVLLRANRPLLASVVLLAAVLTKETATYVVAIYGLYRVVLLITGRSKLGPADVAWMIPGLGFIAFQAILYSQIHSLAIIGSGQHNLGAPLAGLIDGIRHYVDLLFAHSAIIWVGELSEIALITALALLWLGQSAAPLYEKLALLAVVVLGLSAAQGIWLGDVGFRSLDDVYLLGSVVLLSSARRLWPVAVIAGSAWIAVFIELTRFI